MKKLLLAALLSLLPVAALGQIQGIVNGATVGVGFTDGQCLTVVGTGTGTITGAGCSGSPSGAAGGVLGGTYPNPSFASSVGSGAVVLASGATLTNPIVGTQAANDNSTKAASTAYVNASYVKILGSGTGTSVSSGTAETALGQVTIPAALMGANGSVRITALWSYTSSANNKTMRVRFGGSTGTIYSSVVGTLSTTAYVQSWIRNNNSASAQKSYNSSTGIFTTGGGALATGAIDTTSAVIIYMSGQAASSGETITLESYTVEFIPAI